MRRGDRPSVALDRRWPELSIGSHRHSIAARSQSLGHGRKAGARMACSTSRVEHAIALGRHGKRNAGERRDRVDTFAGSSAVSPGPGSGGSTVNVTPRTPRRSCRHQGGAIDRNEVARPIVRQPPARRLASTPIPKRCDARRPQGRFRVATPRTRWLGVRGAFDDRAQLRSSASTVSRLSQARTDARHPRRRADSVGSECLGCQALFPSLPRLVVPNQ